MTSDVTPYLYSLRNRGAKLGLERIRRLLGVLGNPQKDFISITVGGTSGKGSTVAMLSSILREAGFRVGMFTSPHLSGLTERIVVNGEKIPERELSVIVKKIKSAIESDEGSEQPTFFEVITAAAFCYFKEQKTDFAVLEVGLGGRLDATNTTSPLVSIITNVSLEHTRILGSSIQEIAREKAGIIQSTSMVVTAAADEASEVLERICKERNTDMLRVGRDIRFTRLGSTVDGQDFRLSLPGKSYELSMPLLGMHQLENAACAVGAVYSLGLNGVVIPDQAVAQGLRRVKWPGRMEIVQRKPLVILDSAKDAQAMKRLTETVAKDLEYQRLVVVLGISSDKNIAAMVDGIAPIADYIIVTAHGVMDRAANPDIITKEIGRYPKEYSIVSDVKEAVKTALSMLKENDMLLVTGSLFTVAEARELWAGKGDERLGREFNEIPKS